MKNVIVGGQYMLGALIVGTFWSLTSYSIVKEYYETTRGRIQREHDAAILRFGPDNDADRARIKELQGTE